MPQKKKTKKQVKKVARRVPPKKKRIPVAVKKVATPKPVGVVTHFFAKIKVAIVRAKQPITVGAKIGIRGATTQFDQQISSLQFDHKPIAVAKKGMEVGLKVAKRVREGDEVFFVS